MQPVKSSIKHSVLRIIDIILMILWPFVILYFIHLDKLQLIGLLLLGYFILRSVLLSQTGQSNKHFTLLLSLTGVALAGLSLLFNNYQVLMFYPVAVNSTLFLLFTYSLLRPPSVVEQIARLQEPNLTPHGQRYTRKVTQVWCLFFIFNGSIALFTAVWGNPQFWAYWNGLISYLLMGLLFVIEWIIRKRVQRQDPQHIAQ